MLRGKPRPGGVRALGSGGGVGKKEGSGQPPPTPPGPWLHFISRNISSAPALTGFAHESGLVLVLKWSDLLGVHWHTKT